MVYDSNCGDRMHGVYVRPLKNNHFFSRSLFSAENNYLATARVLFLFLVSKF